MRIWTSAAVRVGRVGTCVLLAAAALGFLLLEPAKTSGQAAPSAAANKPGFTDDFAKLKMKFEGASSCSNAKCHGAEEPKPAGATTSAEFTQWSGGDLHANAHKQLEEEASTAIAAKLKIQATDQRCLGCHSTNAPKELQGKGFDLAEGVSCNACHGPSEKWTGPHTAKGWGEKERVATKTHDALLKKWGLFDTKSALARAEMCTSCHLSIDADMVAAGHPEPRFELDYYGSSVEHGGAYASQHWREPTTPFYHTMLWATGQAVAVRDSMQQLATRAGAAKPDAKATTDAYMKAMAHYGVFKAAVTGGGIKADLKAWDAQAAKIAAGIKAKKMADVAAGAKAIAAEAGKVAPTVAATKFDKAKTLAIAQALLKDAVTYKTYGEAGIEQQAYGIVALYSSANPSKTAEDAAGKTRQQILDTLLPAEGELNATTFAAALKKVTPMIK